MHPNIDDVFLVTLSCNDTLMGQDMPFAGTELEVVWSKHAFRTHLETYRCMPGVSTSIEDARRLYDPTRPDRNVFSLI